MKFKGKVDLWLVIILLLGELPIVLSLFDIEDGLVILLVTAIIYNGIVLPFMFRNYVEVADGKLTIVFGFSKDSILIDDIVEVYRTNNPVSSSAASLDRIVIKGRNKSLMCAVKEREQFFEYLKEKNSNITFAKNGNGSKSSKLGKFSLIFTTGVCVIVGILLFTGDIDVEYKEESFVIKASYWYDKEIDYDEVESIEFRDEEISGSRVAGWGSMRLLMGDFHSEELGNYTRYTYTNCDSGVILLVKNREVVISGKDIEGSREIYKELMERCGL